MLTKNYKSQGELEPITDIVIIVNYCYCRYWSTTSVVNTRHNLLFYFLLVLVNTDSLVLNTNTSVGFDMSPKTSRKTRHLLSLPVSLLSDTRSKRGKFNFLALVWGGNYYFQPVLLLQEYRGQPMAM